MKKIIITESQYKRLFTEKMVYNIGGDIDFKGNELSNGGPVSDQWETILNDLDDMLDEAGIKYSITAGNDKFHHRKNPGSRHTTGCAVDFAIRNRMGAGIRTKVFNRKYAKTVFEIMEKMMSKYGGSHDFSWLDEYNSATGHATGGHIHMSINKKWCGKGDSGQEIKSKQTLPANAGEFTGDDGSTETTPTQQSGKNITLDDVVRRNNTTDVISMGSRGAGVKELQTILDKEGYDLGPKGVDGIFGPYTKKAVMAFQTDKKIKVDGIVGAETSEALKS
jgi:hypothetical protein